MVLVLLDPAKSAEPPINSGTFSVNKFKMSSEDFLVAVGVGLLIALAFASKKILLNNWEELS